MELLMEIPKVVPVMTLSNCVLFPQAILPLHIFEPRYRKMLKDVLTGNRLFAVATLNETAEDVGIEPPFPTATVGIIRACQHHADGTANVVLQGLARIRIEEIVSEEPYRQVANSVLPTVAGGDLRKLRLWQKRIRLAFQEYQKLRGDLSKEFLTFFNKLDDPEVFVDLLAFAFCNDVPAKQHFLEILNTLERLEAFHRWLQKRVAREKLLLSLQQGLDEDQIALN